MGSLEIPDSGWLTPEALEALREIRGRHAAKKRATVLLLAFARASGTPVARVFEDERACNQRVWYQKWQLIPAIARALDVCTTQALAWKDAETAQAELLAVQRLRRTLADGRVDAVEGLRSTAREQRTTAGTEAAKVLLKARMTGDEAAPVALDEDGAAVMPVEVMNGDALVGDVSAEFVADVLRELGAVGGAGEDVGGAHSGVAVDSA